MEKKKITNKAFDTKIIGIKSKHLEEGKEYFVTKKNADILVKKKVAKLAK